MSTQHVDAASGARTSRPTTCARRRRTWSATRATRRGRRAAPAAICRSKRTAKTERHHYEGGETRNFATYNPQVARDDMFLLGRREPAAGGKIAPVRSTLGAGAVVDEFEPRAHLHAAAADRGERLQLAGVQPALSAHRAQDRDQDLHRLPPVEATTTTTRSWRSCWRRERTSSTSSATTRTSAATARSAACTVTEWDEPQAVIGSYLHRYAYPDWFAQHEKNGRTLAARLQPRRRRRALPAVARRVSVRRRRQQRHAGLRRREHRRTRACRSVLITAPFSPLGHDTHIGSQATRPASRCRRISRSIRRATPATRCAWRTWSSRSTRSTTTRTSPTRRKA